MQNVDADELTQRPHSELPEDDSSHTELDRVLTAEVGEQEISSDVIRAICNSRLTQRSEYSHKIPVALISSLTMQDLSYLTNRGFAVCLGRHTTLTHF